MKMKPWARLLLGSAASVALVAALVGALELWLAVKHGQFREIANSKGHACTGLPGIAGAEDIAVDWQARQAFVSAKGARAGRGLAAKRGLYRIDLGTMSSRDITPGRLAGSIKPHGISLYADSRGRKSLFVIHHAPAREEILIFDVLPNGDVVEREAITSHSLYNANDVAAVGHRQFYVTNSTRLTPLFSNWFRTRYVLLGWDRSGTVMFFDGRNMSTVVDGLTYANGIAASADKQRLHVSETFAGRISSFARDPKNNALKLASRTPLPGGPDNISVAPDGNLIVAAFPHELEDVEYSWNMEAKRPPAQVVTLKTVRSGFVVAPLWTHDGSRLTGVSVGAPFAGDAGDYSFLVGTIADDHMLVCRATGSRNSQRSN